MDPLVSTRALAVPRSTWPRRTFASVVLALFVAWLAVPSGVVEAVRDLPSGSRRTTSTVAASAVRSGGADPKVDKEYQVKAALLFNFAKYTTWPKSAFKKKTDPIVILIVGDDPFGSQLDKMLAKKKIGGRAFKIERSKSVPKSIDAHIVFSKGLDKAETKALVERCEKSHAVTVGDDADFADQGGLIGFYTEKGKVRFEVNEEQHKKSPVTLSAELLKLARIIKSKGKRRN